LNLIFTTKTEVKKHWNGCGSAMCEGTVYEAGREPWIWRSHVGITEPTMKRADWENRGVKSARAKFRKEVKENFYLNRYVLLDFPDGRRKTKAEDTIGIIKKGMKLYSIWAAYKPETDGFVGKVGSVNYTTLDGVMYVSILIAGDSDDDCFCCYDLNLSILPNKTK
tara:strand:+ start:1355 stop:1852 length:498 start_codon:yes stop_codon:yes gene_type:complete